MLPLDLDCQKQANSICKEMIHFFKVLTLPKSEKSTIAQQLLSLVTSLAQNLKYLIRIGLSSSQDLVIMSKMDISVLLIFYSGTKFWNTTRHSTIFG